MKVVIDINEVDYELCKNPMQPMPFHSIKRAIANGTPLPKGHGRLIDADELLNANIDTFSQQTELKIKLASVIIEADKEEK